jgi:hypothetical protein
MTSSLFDDLAERLREAATFASLDDERSCSDDFARARRSAEEFAYRMRQAEAEVATRPVTSVEDAA